MTIRGMSTEYWIKGYKYTLRIFNNSCFPTSIIVTRTCLTVTVYVHCLVFIHSTYLSIVNYGFTTANNQGLDDFATILCQFCLIFCYLAVHTHTHTYISIYVCLCVYIYVLILSTSRDTLLIKTLCLLNYILYRQAYIM
jgi:hypothetical protein